MQVMALILGLSISCGFSGAAPPADVTNSKGVKSFCKVMRDPSLFQDQVIKLRATAYVLYGGILLTSDQCKVPDVTVHYEQDFEKGSNAAALELLQRFQRGAREAHLRGAAVKAERTVVNVVLEVRLEKNSLYHVKIDQGAATLAAWDYNDEYAFVVARVVSLQRH